LDWDRLGEVLTTIVVMAFILERALAVLFESRFYLARFENRLSKELIAAAVGAVVCVLWKFDALSMILLTDKTRIFGEIITGAVIAGGSKASLKLFHDVLDIRSSAHEAAFPPDSNTGKPSPNFDEAALKKP